METEFVDANVAAIAVTKMVTGLTPAELATASAAEAAKVEAAFATALTAFGPGQLVWKNRFGQLSKLVLRTIDAATLAALNA